VCGQVVLFGICRLAVGMNAVRGAATVCFCHCCYPR
jgi:hypothetical protein